MGSGPLVTPAGPVCLGARVVTLQIPLQVLLSPLAMFVRFTTAGIATGYEINFLKGRITVKQRVFAGIWRG
ncbi:hypothetical protein BSR47_31560 [Bradyrhizobium canariense]|nr:hypothetical protein BSR47_31560 [Bradyrhizobium canariense]